MAEKEPKNGKETASEDEAFDNYIRPKIDLLDKELIAKRTDESFVRDNLLRRFIEKIDQGKWDGYLKEERLERLEAKIAEFLDVVDLEQMEIIKGKTNFDARIHKGERSVSGPAGKIVKVHRRGIKEKGTGKIIVMPFVEVGDGSIESISKQAADTKVSEEDEPELKDREEIGRSGLEEGRERKEESMTLEEVPEKPGTIEELKIELAEAEKILEQIPAIRQGLEEAYQENTALKQDNDELKRENKKLKVWVEEFEKNQETSIDSEIENVFQKNLEHFKEDVRVFYEEWQEKHQENLKLEQEGNQACQDLGIDNIFSSYGMKEAKLINTEVVSVHNLLGKMELKEFIIKSWDLQSQFESIKEKNKNLSVPWDSVIVNFIKGLPERVGNKEIQRFKDIPESLKIFVQHRGFETFLPKRGDDLKLSEFRILDEVKDDEVGRRISATISPGLKRGDDIIVKAGIYLAK